jgi:quinol monooxygenase YgiN
VILVIGTIRVPASGLDRARPAMETMMRVSQAEDGCIEYSYSQDLLDPGLIRVTEIWTSREALAAHFATPHLAAWRAAFPDLDITDRKLNLFVAGDPEPV